MHDISLLKFQAGNGGDGRVSFRREKFVPKGGPDGGDGGDGGSIYLRGNKNLSTLASFAGKSEFKAPDGDMGGKQRKYGAKGDDLIIEVPIGTIVWEIDQDSHADLSKKDINKQKLADISKTKLAEILYPEQQVLLVRGGQGGRGNDQFKSSTNQTPMKAESGEPGEQKLILFELKLLADIGLVGFPNAGKSTFLSKVTKANPRIASYPFTTLEPNLGVMGLPAKAGDKPREIVLADIPGLIEGASQGKGLGFQFLRHIERCRGLMYVLYLEEEVVSDDTLTSSQKVEMLQKQLSALRSELAEYSPDLEELPWFVTVNKADLYDEELRAEIVRELRVNKQAPVIWSGFTGEGIDEVRDKLQKIFN